MKTESEHSTPRGDEDWHNGQIIDLLDDDDDDQAHHKDGFITKTAFYVIKPSCI